MSISYYKPKHMNLIVKRGNPDAISLDGQINEFVHLKITYARDGIRYEKPKCSNGAFNIYWSEHKEAVTCLCCLAK